MKVSSKGLDLVKHYEQLHDGDLHKIGLQPKMDPRGIWTIGYGHALKNPLTGEWIQGEEDFHLISKYYPKYLNITEEEASKLLDEDMDHVENQINDMNLGLNQNQFDSICSFTYNCGIGNFQTSTLLKRIRGFKTDELIRDAFLMWVYSGGKRYEGLVARRKSEAELYCKGDLKFYN